MKELSNWGRRGKDDQMGTVNLVTPAKRKDGPGWCAKALLFRASAGHDDNLHAVVQRMVANVLEVRRETIHYVFPRMPGGLIPVRNDAC